MAWLLDSDICSYAFKKKPAHIASKLSSKAPGQVMVSTVTVYELITGCEKAIRRDHLLRDMNAFLSAFSKVPFTVEDAYRAGAIRADLEQRGTPIGPYDMLLAAQALERGFTLVTNNRREFRRVKGLKLEAW